MNNNGIKVRIFDMKQGLTEYENIKTIRIISKDYNLLIMKDYMPIIGEIVGSVDINGENTVQLNAKVIPSNANKNTEITWTSKKKAVASVN